MAETSRKRKFQYREKLAEWKLRPKKYRLDNLMTFDEWRGIYLDRDEDRQHEIYRQFIAKGKEQLVSKDCALSFLSWTSGGHIPKQIKEDKFWQRKEFHGCLSIGDAEKLAKREFKKGEYLILLGGLPHQIAITYCPEDGKKKGMWLSWQDTSESWTLDAPALRKKPTFHKTVDEAIDANSDVLITPILKDG